MAFNRVMLKRMNVYRSLKAWDEIGGQVFRNRRLESEIGDQRMELGFRVLEVEKQGFDGKKLD